jgi:predicted dehydrogenase
MTGWGIIGTGGIARSFVSDLVLDGRDVRAVGSRSQASADAFAGQFGIPNAYGSYEELVADPSVDVVYIATPHPMHAPNARLALNAGKHVLIEKPITLNAREAEELAELGERHGLLVLEAMWTRFLPHIARIREIIDAGTLGEVRSFTAQHMQRITDDPAHRINDLALGGGALLDLGIYPISFASFLFGAPAEVQAVASFRATGADREVATVFRYDSGAIATTLSASDAVGPNTASIIGTAARIDIDRTWFAPTAFRVIAGDEMVDSYETSITGRGMQFQAREAERLIAAGELSSPLMSVAESVAIMHTMDAVRQRIGLRYPGEG